MTCRLPGRTPFNLGLLEKFNKKLIKIENFALSWLFGQMRFKIVSSRTSYRSHCSKIKNYISINKISILRMKYLRGCADKN